MEIDSREAFEKNPEKVWGFFSQAIGLMEQVAPNEGHKALARLGQLGRMAAIVTQNVDGLHQAAGSENVIEFHGNVRQLHCLKCEARYTWDEVKGGKIPPLCRCGYVLKPTVPLFGDHVNIEAASTAEVLAANAQVMLVACTHGDIAPVNRVPMVAKEYGAVIVEVNRLKSLYTDQITDYFLQGEAGEVLTALSREVEGILASAAN